MKAKFLIPIALAVITISSCGDSGDSSNMDKAKADDTRNTMTTYPSAGDSGTYGSAADSANYNNRNLSADDSAGVKRNGTTGTDTSRNR